MTGSPPPASADHTVHTVPKHPSNIRRKRDLAELETVLPSPDSSSAAIRSADLIDLTADEDPRPSRKHRRTGPSSSTIPRTLPTGPHAELLAELKGKYLMLTTSVISSSKINKKVTAVLQHLGHVDLFNKAWVPGVMMLHARAAEVSKLVTVMEVAKRRIEEMGQVWYQYNRVYEVANEQGSNGNDKNGKRHETNGEDSAESSQMVIEDTVLEEQENEGDAFEPTAKTLSDLTIEDNPAIAEAKKKNSFMSIFLTRVPMPELQAKPSFTLQTNASQFGQVQPSFTLQSIADKINARK